MSENMNDYLISRGWLAEKLDELRKESLETEALWEMIDELLSTAPLAYDVELVAKNVKSSPDVVIKGMSPISGTAFIPVKKAMEIIRNGGDCNIN